MKKLILILSLVLATSSVLASVVKVDLVKIKLNPVDAFGIFKVHGDLKLNVDKHSFDVDSVDSKFDIKALGLGLGQTIEDTYDIYFNRFINLINGNTIALPGFNKGVLASLIINEPSKNLYSSVVSYQLKVNFLMGYGEDASSVCKQTDSLQFTLTQNNLSFKLSYPGHTQAITELKFGIEAIGKEKKLAHIEIVSKDKKSIIKYKNCKRAPRFTK